MSLNEIITVSIDRNTTTPTRAGFGTPLIAAYFPPDIFHQRTKTYGAASELLDDGFKTSDPAYKAAAAVFGQNPSPPRVKIGRRANQFTQSIEVPPVAPVAGDVHKLEVTGYIDSAFASRTVDVQFGAVQITTEADEAAVASALAANIAGKLLSDCTVGTSGAGAAGVVTIQADNTTMDSLYFGVEYTVNGVPQPFNDVTADIDLTSDLDAIEEYDSDWYCLILAENNTADIADAAAWVSTNKKLLVAQTADAAVGDVSLSSDNASIAYDLKAASNDRTMLFWHLNNLDYVSAGMAGRALPEDAGSITWAYKQIAGASAQQFSTTQRTNLENKDVNFLTTIAGVTVTRYGTSLEGEYMDVARGADWLEARIKEDVYTLLIQNDKLPFTDGGIQAVRGVILARLQDGVARDFIAADPEPTCTVPRASEVSAADKGNRTLNDVTFRATLAGAIHKIAIEGELNLT